MSSITDAIVLTAFLLATSVWVGGYVAIAVVARTASATLDAESRVAFFRTLGRTFFWISFPALVIALASGTVLARNVPRGALFGSTAVVAAGLLASFAVAVIQARRMTALRRSLLVSPEAAGLEDAVCRGARSAALLRGILGVLTLVLVVLGAFLAT